MNEDQRQIELEKCGIGVTPSHLYPGEWYAIFDLNGEEYETYFYKTRREAEDKALSMYKEKSGE